MWHRYISLKTNFLLYINIMYVINYASMDYPLVKSRYTSMGKASRCLTIAGCLLLRARLAFGKAGERDPRPPLCTADRRLCMSGWAPSKPGPWPTAWFRSTWMASSKRSSNLLCYKNTCRDSVVWCYCAQFFFFFKARRKKTGKKTKILIWNI